MFGKVARESVDMRKTRYRSAGNFDVPNYSVNHTIWCAKTNSQPKGCNSNAWKGFRKTCGCIMILMMDKYKSQAMPQNPHWHAHHISPSPPFILPTKKLHECYPLLDWTFTRQHGSAKESSITASMGAMHCLCQTQEQRPAVLCLNAGKKHFPYSSIFIWSSRNVMNKTDHKIVEGCKEWEMSKAMIRHYDNSDSMVCTPPRVPSSHHCNHQVSLTKHGSTACEVTSVDSRPQQTKNMEFRVFMNLRSFNTWGCTVVSQEKSYGSESEAAGTSTCRYWVKTHPTVKLLRLIHLKIPET